MIVEIKHVEDVVYRAADHQVSGFCVLTKRHSRHIFIVTLVEAADRLLQLMDVPEKQVLISPRSNHRPTRRAGVKRGSAA